MNIVKFVYPSEIIWKAWRLEILVSIVNMVKIVNMVYAGDMRAPWKFQGK